MVIRYGPWSPLLLTSPSCLSICLKSCTNSAGVGVTDLSFSAGLGDVPTFNKADWSSRWRCRFSRSRDSIWVCWRSWDLRWSVWTCLSCSCYMYSIRFNHVIVLRVHIHVIHRTITTVTLSCTFLILSCHDRSCFWVSWQCFKFELLCLFLILCCHGNS